jgi:hypothetical protein
MSYHCSECHHDFLGTKEKPLMSVYCTICQNHFCNGCWCDNNDEPFLNLEGASGLYQHKGCEYCDGLINNLMDLKIRNNKENLSIEECFIRSFKQAYGGCLICIEKHIPELLQRE